jgi:hypothetical protein
VVKKTKNATFNCLSKERILEFFKVLFKLLPIPQALRANATERKIFGGA